MGSKPAVPDWRFSSEFLKVHQLQQTSVSTCTEGRSSAGILSRTHAFANNEARCSGTLARCLAGHWHGSFWRRNFLPPIGGWTNRKQQGRSRTPDFHPRKFEGFDLAWSSSSSPWLDTELDAPEIYRGPTPTWSLEHGFDARRSAGHGRAVASDTVSKLCEQGRLGEAVEALGLLVQTDHHILKALFYTVLKECAAKKDLPLGRLVHGLIVKKGYESDTFLCNHILRMYASHARLHEATDVFTKVVRPDCYTWSAIISAHVKNGEDTQAIQLYRRMRRSSVKPDSHVFVAALQACARGANLKAGQQVHADVLNSGIKPDLFVCSGLVDMYAKCGCLKEAQKVFDGLPQKSVVTWSAMIAGYAQHGMGQEALHLYRAMLEEGSVMPNSVTFLSVLQACASVGIPALEEGKQLHAQIRDQQGLPPDVVVANSLVNMYAKCGSLEDAQSVFDELSQKTVVTWNAMIAGYSQNGMGQKALSLYSDMVDEGMVAPDCVTFVCLLQACTCVGSPAYEKGKQLHAQIRERGLLGDLFVGNSLVNMYAKCGSTRDAQAVFDGLVQKDVVSWNAMIAGYSQQGKGQEALQLYDVMQEEGVVAPDSVTFVCLLQACASVGVLALEKGKQLHKHVREKGLHHEVFVGSSLVNMYVKCGSLPDAQVVFDRLSLKNVITWSAMMTGYARQGMGQEALGLYKSMQEEGIAALDSPTFVCLLQACASVSALDVGRHLHARIKNQGLQDDVLVASSLVNMYAKSGSIADAQRVFDSMVEKDVVTWSALIAGYTRQGDSEQVFHLVFRMKEDGIQPDSVTFLSVLTVCSHTGLVDKGREYFEAMSRHYNISPSADHFTCMVDLLGRAGRMDEAIAVIRAMPTVPDVAVWHTLLGACRKWGNVEVGREAFHEAVNLDDKDDAAYALMWNIYTSSQMWEQAQEIQARRLSYKAWKQPGQSWWTDMHGQVHSFVVGDE